MGMNELTHLDAEGHARMVDVGAKEETQREAVARGAVLMRPETLRLIIAGGLPKGDVLAVARVAGIMAAKRAPELIPLCHPLLLTHVAVELTLDETAAAVQIEATVRTTGKTGVEMEALTAVSATALTIYDMCKAVDRGMRISELRLAQKRGGKSGEIVLEQ
jgi:cyclic pyranopterin monophosphate synthase